MRHSKILLTSLTLGSALSLASCRKEKPEDNIPQAPEFESEREPNNSPQNANELTRDLPVHGELLGGDIDVLRVAQGRSLTLHAPSTVKASAIHADGRRVELGSGSESGGLLEVPDASWMIELAGQGSWVATFAESENPVSCGFRLGDVTTPNGFAFATLPAEFPVCVTSANGAAIVKIPTIRPAGVQAFEVRLDGGATSIAGTLRVNDGQRTYAEASLSSVSSLPAVRWADGVEMYAVVNATSSAESRAMLRIEPVQGALPGAPMVELEPNDSAVDAMVLTTRAPVAGSLYHLADLDRFRVDAIVGPVRVEVMTATPGSALRVVGGNDLMPIEAVATREGVFEICRLDPVAALGEIRISFAQGTTFNEPLIYQVTLKDAVEQGHELPENDNTPVPDGIPWGSFGVSAGDQGVLTAVQGSIMPAGDVDQWLLHVPPSLKGRAMQKVAIRVATSSAMDLSLRLLDGDRIPLSVSDRQTAGQAEAIEMELPEGYYLVEVSGTGALSCDAQYTLEVAVEALDASADDLARPDGTPSVAPNGGIPVPRPSNDRESGGSGSDDYPW